MLANTLMVVCTHPQDPAREGEFNEWYTGNHVPDVLNAPHWREAVRYKRVKALIGEVPAYLALYQVDNNDIELADTALMHYLGSPNPWRLPMPEATLPASGGLVPLDVWAYYRKTLEVGRNDQSPSGAPKAVLLTLTHPAPGVPVEPLNQWYDARVRDVLETSGFRSAARYELAMGKVGRPSPHLVIFELEADDVEQVDRELARQRDLWLAGEAPPSSDASTRPIPRTTNGEPWIHADGVAYFARVSAPTKKPTLLPK